MSSSSVDKNIVTPSPMAKYGSAIFLSIAIIVGSQSYEIVKETWFGLSSEMKTYSLAPGLLSTLFSGLYIMIMNIRVRSEIIFCEGNKNIIYYITEWGLLILSIIVTAMVWSIFISSDEKIILGMTGMHLLLAAVAFSFVGIRSLAGFAWIVLIFIGITRAVDIDNAMGIAGIFFSICSLMGLTLQAIRLYSGKLGEMIHSDFMGAKDVIHGDVVETKKTTENIVNESVKIGRSSVSPVMKKLIRRRK